MNYPENPRLARLMATGYEEEEVPMPRCPECGAETDTFYKNHDSILGCDVCIRAVCAWDYVEEED